MVSRLYHTEYAAHLFDGWQETIIWSCLQNVMGAVYTDDQVNPGSAMAVLGDFCFFAGEPKEELVQYKPKSCKKDFIIMVPQSPGWAALVEQGYNERAKKVTRYAMKKEPDVFDTERLQRLTELPPGYELRMMDEELYYQCMREDWSRDLVSQYEDYETYQKHGLGAVVLWEGEPVSGASSYSGYLGGIEIEIDTKEAYRRQGLAAACGAKLILACLERNLYPSWDAHNPESAALARKLGYHLDGPYTAYEIWGYEE
ncbi:MAG: GNAT family N-acetyltransferase [Clostridiales bacterium]|nr:GNAT family N-acetyltransferase [Clostridiales bacterium]